MATTAGTAEAPLQEQVTRLGTVRYSQLSTSRNVDESLHHDAVVLAVKAEADVVQRAAGVVESRRDEEDSNMAARGRKTVKVTTSIVSGMVKNKNDQLKGSRYDLPVRVQDRGGAIEVRSLKVGMEVIVRLDELGSQLLQIAEDGRLVGVQHDPLDEDCGFGPDVLESENAEARDRGRLDLKVAVAERLRIETDLLGSLPGKLIKTLHFLGVPLVKLSDGSQVCSMPISQRSILLRLGSSSSGERLAAAVVAGVHNGLIGRLAILAIGIVDRLHPSVGLVSIKLCAAPNTRLLCLLVGLRVTRLTVVTR